MEQPERNWEKEKVTNRSFLVTLLNINKPGSDDINIERLRVKSYTSDFEDIKKNNIIDYTWSFEKLYIKYTRSSLVIKCDPVL